MKKDWAVNQDGKVTHVVPLNDFKAHEEDFQEQCGLPACKCSCKPKIELAPHPFNHIGKHWIIIHNSYDGREGVEWAEELLK